MSIFPKEKGSTRGWTLNYAFIQKVYEETSLYEDGASMEQIETVLLSPSVTKYIETELAQLKYLEQLVTHTNKRVIPGEKDSIDALVDYIKKLEEKCADYEKNTR